MWAVAVAGRVRVRPAEGSESTGRVVLDLGEQAGRIKRRAAPSRRADKKVQVGLDRKDFKLISRL